MSFIRKEFRIGGMTCVNCQNKIKQKLIHASGIKEVSVSYNTGIARVSFDSDVISFKKIKHIIEELDYQVLPDGQQEKPDVSTTVSFLVIIIGLFLLLQRFGILNLLVPSQLADSGMGYGMLFVVGVLTSVHCIAMCGGINLSQCLPRTEGEDGVPKGAAYLPSVLYNLGRVFSYTMIGFLLGLIGMVIGGGSGTGISTTVQGILKLIAGVFMVIMGFNLLGIFPWLRRLQLRMPGFLVKKIGAKKAVSTQPFLIGLLNGLMPCGPLQSMQIIALVSGNPFAGALSMFLFSLGTVPLMLGLGSLVSALGRKFARTVMSVGAVLVVVLGLAMLSQGGTLAGIHLPEFGLSGSGTAGTDAEVTIVDGVQIVESTLASGQYPSITVQAGMPVRWTVHAPQGSINGCNYRMIIPDYEIEYSFKEGDNIIEFTPTKEGTVRYSCWMGMIRGNIYIIEGN